MRTISHCVTVQSAALSFLSTGENVNVVEAAVRAKVVVYMELAEVARSPTIRRLCYNDL